MYVICQVCPIIDHSTPKRNHSFDAGNSNLKNVLITDKICTPQKEYNVYEILVRKIQKEIQADYDQFHNKPRGGATGSDSEDGYMSDSLDNPFLHPGDIIQYH